MKKLTSLLLLLFQIMSQGTRPWERDTIGHKGTVRSIRVERAQNPDDPLESARNPVRAYSYDATGKEIEMVIYNSDTSVAWRVVTHYDKQGHRWREDHYDSRALESTHIHTQNVSLRTTKITDYDALGRVCGWSIVRFDKEMKRVRSETSYNADGSFCIGTTWEYDRGLTRITEVTREGACRGPSHVARKRVLKLDEYGNVVALERYESPTGGLLWKEVRSFDNDGNIKERAGYDDTGRVRRLTVFSYEFDPRGNWTKRVESSAGDPSRGLDFRPVEVLYRTIAYY